MALTQTEAEVQSLLNQTAGKGWTEHVEGTYISEGTAQEFTARAKLECDGTGGATNTTYAPPTGVLWDTTNDKILGAAVGDAYDVRIEFDASNASVGTWFDIEFDIGGAVGVVSARTYTMPKTAGTAITFSVGVPLYSLATFITNGCEIYITPNSGTLKVWNQRVLVKRDFVAAV